MQTNNLGYPRVGSKRELKKASEAYWAKKISSEELQQVAKEIRTSNWKLQKEQGIDLIPSNDFSFYDQVLDMCFSVGAVPERYAEYAKSASPLDLYFAMARGYQNEDFDLTAMEMTKWFDTNYHYLVPEFTKDQEFFLKGTKAIDEFWEAKRLGIQTKPVLLGPVSFLLLGKTKGEDFDKLELLERLLPVYLKLLTQLAHEGAEWIQIDEPILSLGYDDKVKEAIIYSYKKIAQSLPQLKVIFTSYFESVHDELPWLTQLPIAALHLDLIRGEQEQIYAFIQHAPDQLMVSLGVVDGRNIWRTDLQKAVNAVKAATKVLGYARVIISPSCSLLHAPCDLDLETELQAEIKQWLSFAKQKLEELALIAAATAGSLSKEQEERIQENIKALVDRSESKLIHDEAVKSRVSAVTEADKKRNNVFASRQAIQHEKLSLPLFPTTTIGSFPQTKEVRQLRAKFKKAELSTEDYEKALREETVKAIRLQEAIGLDVLVHGEFERNDMVEYFGEQLNGFTFTKFGWVQSYGSRCVKPPIIYGDVSRPAPMTVAWSKFSQDNTEKWVKGMLTGPVTILQWSFVRDDQPRQLTCEQIALAIRDEVVDLERAGISVIQVDEPAIREGLPLQRSKWEEYLIWAVGAFRLATSGVADDTQVHTHMCYSEFNDIIEHIAAMDADVITIECSRSQMDLLDAFSEFNYPNEIGPGVYDIHSPRVPSKAEMVALMQKASDLIDKKQLWVNPDCGLKTRGWEETKLALKEMVDAAKALRVLEEAPVA